MPARFLYARFSTHAAAADWVRTAQEFALDLPGVTVPRTASPSPATIAWRLVSENRREIARGCSVHESDHRVQADIANLMACLDDLVIHTVSAPRLRSTGWCVSRHGGMVMMGARRYEKRLAAEHAAALTLRSLAELAATPAKPDVSAGQDETLFTP